MKTTTENLDQKLEAINELFTPFQQTLMRHSIVHRILYIEKNIENGRYVGSEKKAKEIEVNLSEELLSDFSKAKHIRKNQVSA